MTEDGMSEATESQRNMRLRGIAALAAEYCSLIEQAREMEKDEFILELSRLLPQIYVEFVTFGKEEAGVYDYGYYPTAVEEDWYESVRRNLETLLGGDDTYLETFEEDMKYSDTPIACSIAEGLADIFQALYNFISVVRDSEGEEMGGAYLECRDNFDSYWSQTLCNVLRAVNNLRVN